MKLNALTLVLTLAYSVAGLLAFFDAAWFFSLLGDYYGVFNLHFVKDAGLALISSGLLLGLSLFNTPSRFAYAFAGALFVVLHGIFHIQMLASGMVESYIDITKEVVVIILPALATLILVCARYIEQRSTTTRPEG